MQVAMSLVIQYSLLFMEPAAEMAMHLLWHRANMEIPSYEGYTALHYVSENGHAEVIRCLLQLRFTGKAA